ncbi:MAG TPA: hypothetical protein VIY48_05180 [Candidatus Paceibacterota bacterium]
MDLFGSKSRIRLELVQEQLAEKERLLSGAVALLRERDKELFELSRKWTIAQEDVRILEKQLEEAKKPTAITSHPLYLGENEEDLQWQYDNNMINLTEYQQLLKELDFQNTEIELDVAPVGSDFTY